MSGRRLNILRLLTYNLLNNLFIVKKLEVSEVFLSLPKRRFLCQNILLFPSTLFFAIFSLLRLSYYVLKYDAR